MNSVYSGQSRYKIKYITKRWKVSIILPITNQPTNSTPSPWKFQSSLFYTAFFSMNVLCFMIHSDHKLWLKSNVQFRLLFGDQHNIRYKQRKFASTILLSESKERQLKMNVHMLYSRGDPITVITDTCITSTVVFTSTSDTKTNQPDQIVNAWHLIFY